MTGAYKRDVGVEKFDFVVLVVFNALSLDGIEKITIFLTLKSLNFVNSSHFILVS